MTCFHLISTRPDFAFKALILTYGVFDLSGYLPRAHHFNKNLILTLELVEKYIEAFLPGSTETSRRDAAISPFYANLWEMAAKAKGGKLPPVFFSCGTEDLLLDDTLFMATKWRMSDAEAVVKIYPGAPHGFTLFPPDVSDESGEFRKDLVEFIKMIEKT